ncbi:MAG: YtxH domain-containing protein [Coriobacteriales bacterium]|jgi:gas vesicle protein|nr:YtxH domain-containing protein [Coriobacteriales bacterium]
MGKITSFIIGGVAGAALGLLFAPRSGSETRAIVAEKVDECWGKSQDFYNQSVTRIQAGVSKIQPEIARRGDELREKIDNARTIIADQVARNAQSARNAINDRVPVAAEKVTQAVDSARNQIDSAASALRGRATNLSEGAVPAVAAVAPSAQAINSADTEADVADPADTLNN